MKETIVAALAAFALLPAPAQSIDYTPTAKEAKQARDNTKRDAKLADEMEKARLKEEAKKPAVYIPAPKKEAASKPLKSPATFTAVAPGEKKTKTKKKAD